MERRRPAGPRYTNPHLSFFPHAVIPTETLSVVEGGVEEPAFSLDWHEALD
jgi:hypothetical protein